MFDGDEITHELKYVSILAYSTRKKMNSVIYQKNRSNYREKKKTFLVVLIGWAFTRFKKYLFLPTTNIAHLGLSSQANVQIPSVGCVF